MSKKTPKQNLNEEICILDALASVQNYNTHLLRWELEKLEKLRGKPGFPAAKYKELVIAIKECASELRLIAREVKL